MVKRRGRASAQPHRAVPTARPAHRVRAVALLLAALPALAPTPASAQFGDPEINSISFEGNNAFNSDELRRRIFTRATECRSFVLQPFCAFGAEFAEEPSFLRRVAIPEDAARLALYYSRRGFRQAVVDTVVAYGEDSLSVDITFRITENEPVRVATLDLVGLDDFGPEVSEGLLTRAGSRFDVLAVDADRDTLENRLKNLGHAHAEVYASSFIPTANPLQAELTLQVFPGPLATFGEITVSGTGELREQVVRRMLPFQRGSLYRHEDVLDGQRNLYALEIVRSATVDVDLDHEPQTEVPVHVLVGEGDLRRVNWGAGLSTADCANAQASWTHRNLLGGAQRLLLRASVSNLGVGSLQDVLCSDAGTGVYGLTNWSVGGELTLPWVKGARNSASLGLFYERQSLNDVFIRTSLGATATISHSFGRGAALAFAWRPQYAELDASDLFFCVSFVVCDPADIAELETFNALAPLAMTLSRTGTDQIFNPTRGSNVLLDLEYARSWTRSAFEFDRVIGEASWYKTLGRDVIFATRVRMGLVAGRGFGQQVGTPVASVVHPEKRFYAGGANSVRGYPQGQLGPRVLVVSVADLLGGESNSICKPAEIIALSCDAGDLAEEQLLARPTGGSGVVVGNAEFRIWLAPAFQAATFLDLGQVWTTYDLASVGDLVFSPGLGLRYFSPVGPIRVDLGYRLAGGEQLRVVTQQIRPFDPDSDDPGVRIEGPDNSPLPFVRTDELAVLEPRFLFEDTGSWSLNRLQFHISIGQAF